MKSFSPFAKEYRIRPKQLRTKEKEKIHQKKIREKEKKGKQRKAKRRGEGEEIKYRERRKYQNI